MKDLILWMTLLVAFIFSNCSNPEGCNPNKITRMSGGRMIQTDECEMAMYLIERDGSVAGIMYYDENNRVTNTLWIK